MENRSVVSLPDVDIRDFAAMRETGRQMVAAAGAMDERLNRLRAVDSQLRTTWVAESQESHDAVQRRFEAAYTELKDILAGLGNAIVKHADESENVESDLIKLWV
jgi:WXG100 family type VII secretion target